MKYKCDDCGEVTYINFTCKCRFCNSCSKPASDKWINHLFSWWPSHLHYYHLFFTIPEELRNFFQNNRKALNVLSDVGNKVLIYFFDKNYHCKPGFVSVIHTFGAQLNRNCHVHFLITAGGISNDELKYILAKDKYLPYNALKVAWKKLLLYHIQQWAYKNMSYNEFLAILDKIKFLRNQKDPKDNEKEKSRFVYCSKKATSYETILSYMGRYLKRPVIGESRILDYSGDEVTFEYKDKYDDETKVKTVSSLDFIGLLVQHIPNRHFKLIRYGGIFANRCKEKFLKLIYTIFANTGRMPPISKIPINFRQRMIAFTGRDPCICKCGGTLFLHSINLPYGKGFLTIEFDTS